jgi:hypothetical protein
MDLKPDAVAKRELKPLDLVATRRALGGIPSRLE